MENAVDMESHVRLIRQMRDTSHGYKLAEHMKAIAASAMWPHERRNAQYPDGVSTLWAIP
eukprot:5778486-Pyramimonas_sp.AAC.1